MDPNNNNFKLTIDKELQDGVKNIISDKNMMNLIA